jgi:hypothetical protein
MATCHCNFVTNQKVTTDLFISLKQLLGLWLFVMALQIRIVAPWNRGEQNSGYYKNQVCTGHDCQPEFSEAHPKNGYHQEGYQHDLNGKKISSLSWDPGRCSLMSAREDAGFHGGRNNRILAIFD